MLAVSEALVAICVGAVGVNPVQKNPYYDSIFVMILLPVIQYLIVMIVRNFVGLKNDEAMPKSYWIVTVSLPFLVTVFIIFLYTKSSLPAAFLVICGILLLAINFMTIYLYDNTIRNMQARKENEILEVQNLCQQKQAESMQNIMEQIRGERHDFYKHLSSLQQMLTQEQYGGSSKICQ